MTIIKLGRWDPNKKKTPGGNLFLLIGGWTHCFTILFSYWFLNTTINNPIVLCPTQKKRKCTPILLFFIWGSSSNRKKGLFRKCMARYGTTWSNKNTNHPYFDGLSYPFVIQCGMVCYCFTNINASPRFYSPPPGAIPGTDRGASCGKLKIKWPPQRRRRWQHPWWWARQIPRLGKSGQRLWGRLWGWVETLGRWVFFVRVWLVCVYYIIYICIHMHMMYACICKPYSCSVYVIG